MKARWFRSRRFWLILISSMLVVLLGSQLPLQDWLTTIKNWLPTLGWWAMPAFILIYLIATVLGLPNVVLILISGTLFGFLQGIVSSSIADTLGAIACFWVGRTIARKRVKRLICKNPNLAQLDHAVAQKRLENLTAYTPVASCSVQCPQLWL